MHILKLENLGCDKTNPLKSNLVPEIRRGSQIGVVDSLEDHILTPMLPPLQCVVTQNFTELYNTGSSDSLNCFQDLNLFHLIGKILSYLNFL